MTVAFQVRAYRTTVAMTAPLSVRTAGAAGDLHHHSCELLQLLLPHSCSDYARRRVRDGLRAVRSPIATATAPRRWGRTPTSSIIWAPVRLSLASV